MFPEEGEGRGQGRGAPAQTSGAGKLLLDVSVTEVTWAALSLSPSRIRSLPQSERLEEEILIEDYEPFMPSCPPGRLGETSRRAHPGDTGHLFWGLGWLGCRGGGLSCQMATSGWEEARGVGDVRVLLGLRAGQRRPALCLGRHRLCVLGPNAPCARAWMALASSAGRRSHKLNYFICAFTDHPFVGGCLGLKRPGGSGPGREGRPEDSALCALGTAPSPSTSGS